MNERRDRERDADDQLRRMRERIDEVQQEIDEAEREAADIDPARKAPRFIEEEEGGNPPG